VSRVDEARAVMRLATRVGRMVDSLASVRAVEVDDLVWIAESDPASSSEREISMFCF
jgi:hypothetical protein